MTRKRAIEILSRSAWAHASNGDWEFASALALAIIALSVGDIKDED